MLTVSEDFKQAMTSPVRSFVAEVALQEDAENPGNLSLYTHEDRIKKIQIQRVGDNSKFFGYGIGQRLSIDMIDLPDEIQPISKSSFKVRIGIVLASGEAEWVSYPTFYLTEKNRHEEKGDITLTAYDKIDQCGEHLVSDLGLQPPYTVRDFIQACADLLEVEVAYENIQDSDYGLNLSYEEGANFDGAETIREALNMAAEAIQAIYFIDYDEKLHFKRLDVHGAPVATITPEDYFSFSHSDNKRLVSVAHVTELGDNVSIDPVISGTTQHVRENAFWTLREDIATIVEHATANTKGLTIHQFDCDWRGFPLLEIGDKIELQQVCVEGCVEEAFVLDDVITYDGGYSQKTQWKYQNNDNETPSNPTNIGDAINHTFARVDKVNREIQLVASKSEENSSRISSIQMDTESITQSVKKVETTIEENLGELAEEVATLTSQTELMLTKDDVKIIVSEEMENGVDKITTSTGFTFNEEGLTVSKEDSELTTLISEDGMTVSRNGTEVLIADNQGVKARNLHATTYLIIGKNSRFEDFNGNRTGCFWIGN